MTLSLLGLMRPALCRSLVALVPMVRSPQLVVISRVQLLLPNIFHQNMVPPAASCVRFYATKKSKAKAAKGQASKVNINSSLVEDIISLEEVKEDMAAVLTTLKDDFSRNLSIRTSPGALDHIVVGAATRSLRESSMKLNPEVDGTIIRVAIPKVTREHRENLAKLAKQFSNKAKESLRKVRSNAITQVKKAKDTVSEDTIRLVEKQIGQMADSFAADVDKQLTTKTKELLG
uniref:Ribosome-recycling factor, mitochondrial n=1 Tax=Salmo salar TaxID=8030 RepID=B5XDZ9_SALSA|nr:Ribosome recycling factor, mitochondrial precursor [Salmo salar]